MCNALWDVSLLLLVLELINTDKMVYNNNCLEVLIEVLECSYGCEHVH